MMVPFSSVVMWTFKEKTGNGWKKILWYSGKIAFIFSVSIEMLQLLFRLGTFQLSDIFYNTVGGVLGGLVYYVTMKARKHLSYVGSDPMKIRRLKIIVSCLYKQSFK